MMVRCSLAVAAAVLALAAAAPGQVTTPPDSCLLQALMTIPPLTPVTVVRDDSLRVRGYLDRVNLGTGSVRVRLGKRSGGDLTEVPRERIVRFETACEPGHAGTVIGAVLGGLVGAAAFAALAVSDNDQGLEDVESNVLEGIGFGAMGAAVGALAGGLLGHAADKAGAGVQVVDCREATRR